jgi:hypothetical protein
LIRVQGFKGFRIRVKITEKHILTEKVLNIGTVFFYIYNLEKINILTILAKITIIDNNDKK